MMKAGVFDIGGVLLRWTNLPLYEDVDQTLHVTEEQRMEHWKKYMDALEVGKITEKEFWEGFIKDAGATGELPSGSLLQREFKKRFTPDEEVLHISQRLKEKGLKIAIISNTNVPHAEVMRASHLFDEFETVILSNEVGFRKPEKGIYELAIEKLAVAPDEAFFVDDLPENVEGARKAGMHGILFINEEQLVNEIRALGVDL